jgi:hypothetical protein
MGIEMPERRVFEPIPVDRRSGAAQSGEVRKGLIGPAGLFQR